MHALLLLHFPFKKFWHSNFGSVTALPLGVAGLLARPPPFPFRDDVELDRFCFPSDPFALAFVAFRSPCILRTVWVCVVTCTRVLLGTDASDAG